MKSTAQRILQNQQLGLVLIIAALLVVAQVANPQALQPANLIEILRSSALYFVAACAATLVLVGGGLDLSIGSLFAVGGVATGILINAGVPWPVAIFLALAICGVLGLINASLITWVGVPPFIATLGMLFAAGGLVTVVTAGVPRFGFPTGFTDVGQLSLFGIPFLVYYAMIIGVLAHVVLQHTVFGYDTRALGGNAAAARANGIRASRMNVSLYVTSSVIAGLCGVLLASRVATADPGAGGTGFAFQVLAAAIIGGTSLFGGVGTIAGTALGALLFSVINNTLAITNTNPQWQNVATGVILVAAVAFDHLRRRRRFKMDR